MFATFTQFETWLNAKGLFHMDFGLERMKMALTALGLEKPTFKVIQVLGTNGKGSTCAFLDSLARAHGLKSGLYTSPHFLSVKERIQINGQQVEDGFWLWACNELAARIEIDALTYFEFLTVLAIYLFREQQVDLAILEAGLGGAHDATTAIVAHCCLFTPIALDHAAIIGPGLAQIANDKASALPGHGRAFSAGQFPVAARILAAKAEARAGELTFVAPLENGRKLGLSGQTQFANAGLALAGWHWLADRLGIAPQNDASGLARAFIPGRMQHLAATAEYPELILDGSHNPHAIQACLRQLPQAVRTVIFSPLADKDWQPSLAMLGRLRVPVLIPELSNPRAADVCKIAELLPQASAIRGENPLRAALGLAKGPTLLCGSLYLLAEFYKLHPSALHP